MTGLGDPLAIDRAGLVVGLMMRQLGRDSHAFETLTIKEEYSGLAVINPGDGLLDLHSHVLFQRTSS
jgi:hypothetical protein